MRVMTSDGRGAARASAARAMWWRCSAAGIAVLPAAVEAAPGSGAIAGRGGKCGSVVQGVAPEGVTYGGHTGMLSFFDALILFQSRGCARCKGSASRSIGRVLPPQTGDELALRGAAYSWCGSCNDVDVKPGFRCTLCIWVSARWLCSLTGTATGALLCGSLCLSVILRNPCSWKSLCSEICDTAMPFTRHLIPASPEGGGCHGTVRHKKHSLVSGFGHLPAQTI